MSSNKQPIPPAADNRSMVARATLVYLGVCIFAVCVLVRIANIQFFEGDRWKVRVERLTTDLREIPAMRGNIYSADGSLLATSIPVYDIRMDFRAEGLSEEVFFGEVDSLARGLSALFGTADALTWKQNLVAAYKAGKRYHLVVKGASFNKVKAARELPIFRRGRFKGGVIFEKRTVRQRPLGELAVRTLGYEREGVQPVGLEGAFNNELKGRPGRRYEKRLAGGIWMPVGEGNEIDPEDGADIITTLNVNLQDLALSALRKQLVQHNARHGSVVLMEVQTGYVRAIANLTRVEEGIYREDYNYAVGEATEPGSTFKLPALMAALEDGLIALTDSVDTENGRYRFYDRIMRDSNDKGYGKITLQEAFEKSSNVGISRVIFEAYKENPQRFIDRLHHMGLNDQLGLSIAGEGKPRIKSVSDKSWSGVTLPWMSIGYEVLQTPLQTLAFYNAIANNGTLVQPQFVEAIARQGRVMRNIQPVVLRNAICSGETLKAARQLLEGVVTERGTASNLRNPYYSIAGKTGTAQIANASYGYKSDQAVSYQASFVGYFPADEPLYSCMVVINGPTNQVYYGNQVAGPIFKELADKIYAENFELQQRPGRKLPEVRLVQQLSPASANGHLNELATVCHTLNIPLKAAPGEATDFVRTQALEHGIATFSYRPEIKAVPDVRGMGLKDALYLLEQCGLQVQVRGAGLVKNQSVRPGTRVGSNRQITIELT